MEIERDFLAPDNAPRTPDFALVRDSEITDAMEHKASLQKAERALALVSDVKAKYEVLTFNGVESRPIVTLFYPLAKQEIVKDIVGRLPVDLALCSYDQRSLDTEIRFKLHGVVRSEQLGKLLRGDPMVFDPSLVFSRHKFIRAEPPIVYTAFEVWRLLLTLQPIKAVGKREFTVTRDALADRIEKFYPSWIRNRTQISNSRIARTLDFLERIGFVQWKAEEQVILVYSTRGTRSGDLLQYFAEQMAKVPPSRRFTVGKALAAKQKTLFDPFGPKR